MKTTALQLFKNLALKLPVELLGITPQAEEQRNKLALTAAKVKTVKTAADQELAVTAARDIRTYVKLVQDAGKAFRRPMVDFSKRVSTFEQDHITPLLEEQDRLEKLIANFQVAEQRRVEEEERQRHEQIRRAEAERVAAEQRAAAAQNKAQGRKGQAAAAQAQEQAERAAEVSQALITAPLPAATKATGVAIKKVLKWEVTDLSALVAARPDLCKIEPKASAINAVCIPEMPNKPPGLELWWENEAVVNKW